MPWTTEKKKNTVDTVKEDPATPLFSPACWEPGFQAWAQSPCPELSRRQEEKETTEDEMVGWHH